MLRLKIKVIFYILLPIVTLFLSGCDLKSDFSSTDGHTPSIEICRYDRLESRYLTTGDFSALQQMSTDYPIKTRTLIEDILQVGKVTDTDINSRFLQFFQDSTLQLLISDTEAHFADMTNLNKEFNKVFNKMLKELPKVPVPDVYTQIGGLNQSIVINNKSIGVCLDKYLGKDYHLYKKFYSEDQRKEMNEDYIVADALGFYLISVFPMTDYEDRPQIERDLYLGKIMWVTNYLVGKGRYITTYVRMVNNYMQKYRNITVDMLLDNDDYDEIIKTNRE